MLDFLTDDARQALGRLKHALEHGSLTPAIMAYEVAERPQIESLLVTDAEGGVRFTTVEGETGSLKDTPHFQAVRDGAAIAYGEAVLSPTLKKYIVPIAVPYRRDGRFAGMVLARLSTRKMAELFQSRLAGEGAAITYVTDHLGRAIAHPDMAVVEAGQSLATEPPVAAALAGRAGWTRFGEGESARIAGHLRMPIGWVVVSSREATGGLARAGDRLRHQLYVVVPFCLLAGLAALGWGFSLARPLEAMASTMRRVRDEGLKAEPFPRLEEVPVSAHVGEYATLATSFNALTRELSARFAEVVGYQEELEAQNEELIDRNEALAASRAEAERQAGLAAERQSAIAH
ncbi:MAG: cache domain-containing protein, partial [Candidatus Sericytochromatia bacterium]